MKSLLLALHLIFVGVWLGCVITEALFERALLGKGREQELILAVLHKRVDVFVEVPAFMVVLITGGFLLSGANISLVLKIKIAVALVAIAANAFCVFLVFKRSAHACVGNWQAFEQTDSIQHKVGAVVLLGILISLCMGLYLYAGA